MLASWLDKDAIAKDALMLPPSEARRLFGNEWIDPAADCDYLRRDEVDACRDLGDHLKIRNRLFREIGVTNYVASIDYAPRKDRTVFLIGHEDGTGRFVIDRMDVW